MAALRTITVDGVSHQIDYEGLANKPIPAASAADAGKVFTVQEDGTLDWTQVPTELPSHTNADEGKVLTVTQSGGVEFSSPASDLPTYDTRSAGKVLAVADGSSSISWTDVAELIPTTNSPVEGLFLGVDSVSSGGVPTFAWSSVATLPTWASSSAGSIGDVLTMTSVGISWEAVSQSGLPDVTGAESGYFLGLVGESGEGYTPTWMSVPSMPDDTYASVGDILVYGNGRVVEWQSPNGFILPSWDTENGADDGKVLGIVSGELAWITL